MAEGSRRRCRLRTAFEETDDLQGADRLPQRRTAHPHLLGDDPFRKQFTPRRVPSELIIRRIWSAMNELFFLNLVWATFSKVIRSLELVRPVRPDSGSYASGGVKSGKNASGDRNDRPAPFPESESGRELNEVDPVVSIQGHEDRCRITLVAQRGLLSSRRACQDDSAASARRAVTETPLFLPRAAGQRRKRPKVTFIG